MKLHRYCSTIPLWYSTSMLSEPLIDREAELSALRQRWETVVEGSPQLVVVSGHRRVGKTFLLLHLLERLAPRRTVYYAASQQAEGVELRQFAAAAVRQLGDDAIDASGGSFPHWEAALRFLIAQSRLSPLAVVLDEMPNLIESTRGFASIVQNAWDRASVESPKARLLLVLCGSAVSVMESAVGSGGALHRRESLHLRLQPFDLPQAALLLPELEPESIIEAYAACGGYPLHLKAWDTGASTQENLSRLAGSPGGLLLEDAEALRGDLPEGPGFGRVLAAVGCGRTRYSDIQGDAGQRIEYPLDLLVKTGLVRREVPIGSPRRTRPQYGVRDPYLRFWFQLLHPNSQLIEGGQGRVVLERAWPRWRQHLGWTFEEAARHHAVRLVQRGRLAGDLVVGRWWTSHRTPVEIDVVGLAGNRTALAGEASWSREPVSPRHVQALRDKLANAPEPLPTVDLCFWRRGPLSETSRAQGVRRYGPEHVIE